MLALLIWDLPSRFLPEEYPGEDVRSITEIWEELKQPGDHTFVYSGARNGFRLYSSEPLEITAENEFSKEAKSGSASLTLLNSGISNQSERYFEVIPGNIPANAERLWFIVAHVGTLDLPVLKRAFYSAGFEKAQQWDTEGDAELLLYHRAERKSSR